jgi:hypothetical protein
LAAGTATRIVASLTKVLQVLLTGLQLADQLGVLVFISAKGMPVSVCSKADTHETDAFVL